MPVPSPFKTARAASVAAMFGAVALAACGSGGETKKGSPPAPSVIVTTVRVGDVPNEVELTGRIQAVRSAEVRARVDGIVLRRVYREGSYVRAGAVLFEIDPRDKRALLQQAQASLDRALATRSNARSVVNRYAALIDRRAVSEQENDAAVADLGQAEASVSEARAALARANLELGYTTVRAPISGLVSRSEVSEGALVSAASGTLLTRVDQLDPAYAVFAESNSAFEASSEQVRSGELSLPSSGQISVRLTLENGQAFDPVGYIDFADQAVDTSTGTRTLRARFANPRGVLIPGQFVRGRIEGGVLRNGVRLPARAVQIQNEAATVTVVGQDGTAQPRPVTLGAQVEGDWIIQSGLQAGERVIVEGWQNIQPGQKVNAKTAPANRTPPTAPAATASGTVAR